MNEVIIIFIVIALIMGAFCIFVVVQDAVITLKERYQNYKERKKATEEKKHKESDENIEELDIEEIVQKEIIERNHLKNNQQEDVKEDKSQKLFTSENTVAFSTAIKTMTHEEKYLQLSSEYKKYYDEIVRYSIGIEGSKRFKNASSEEYKLGRNSLVKMKIKRNIVVCELIIPNLGLRTYANDNKINVKQAPTTIKVVDEASLSAVKYSIEIIVKAINEEKEYKKEQAKLRRKKNDDVLKDESNNLAS